MSDQQLLDRLFLREAYDQAKASYDEGGLPIGAAMAENGAVIASGHNRRVQGSLIKEHPGLWDEDIAGTTHV